MLNVLFYHANSPEDSSNNRFYLNTVALYLKTYIDINYTDIASKINWLLPQQEYLGDQLLIDMCNNEKVDLLCTSHYIWSHDILIPQLARIKNKISAKIVAGGPSIDVHVNDNFFQKYPFIDYSIYGAGEKAFADLIKSELEQKKIIAFNTSNIAYRDKTNQKTVVAKFEYVPALPVSPYVHNKELFSQMVKYVQNLGHDVAVPFAMTRGCPYACTFCDWNAGLSNKVTRSKARYEDDIDLFAELGVKTLYLADANIGQWDDDIAMISYMAKKNIEENAGFQVEGNLSKLRKKNNLKIYHLMAQGKLINKYGFIFSVQDINKQVLDNIDRPDVTWEVHREMILELLDHYPDYVVKLQLIQGLPGQTLESWRETLRTISKERVIAYIFVNELLMTSPAALDPEYKEKFNFKYSHAERYTSRKSAHKFYRGTIPQSCFSFTQLDFVKMVCLSQIYLLIMAVRTFVDDYKNIDVEFIVDGIWETENCSNVIKNLYNNWQNDKFYYTINFDGQATIIAGDSMAEHISEWVCSKTLQKIFLLGTKTNELKKKMYNLFNTVDGKQQIEFLLANYY